MNLHLPSWGVPPLSSLSLPNPFLCAVLRSSLFNKFSIAPYLIAPFFSFSLSRRIYIKIGAPTRPFVPSSPSRSARFSLRLHPLFCFFFRLCKWQTLGAVDLSKAPCCYLLEISQSLRCLFCYSSGTKRYVSEKIGNRRESRQ